MRTLLALLSLAFPLKAQLAAPGDVIWSNGRLHFLEAGNKSGPAVLLVHGTPGDAKAYNAILKQDSLTGKAHLFSIDRVGFGSSKPARPVTTLKAQAEHASHFFDHVREGAIIVGHSYGGPVALQMAVDYPDKVKALVLVASAADPAHEQIMWYQKLARWPLISGLLPEMWYTSNEELIPLREELEKLKSRLAQIKIPVIVIQGGKDSLVPAANADYLEQQLTGAQLAIERYPNLNHFIPFIQPEIVTRAILRLLEKATVTSSH